MRMALLVFLAACGRAPAAPISEPAGDAYTAAADRALAMADGGWIVSRYDDGTAEHQGDSLLFTGMAMGVLDCDRGAAPEAALVTMMEEAHGGFYRHPSQRDRAASLDGALGFYWGLARRAARCPDALAGWAGALDQHRSAGSLPLPNAFGYLRLLLLSRAGLGSHPGAVEKAALETEVAGWALAVRAARAACFRVHLGLLTLQAMEALSEAPSASGKASFCEATKGMRLANVDEWCGRGGLADWQAAYVPDRWSYAFERCEAYESPDGRAGLHTPGIDNLEAFADLASAQ